ncbi:hypothetical protein [Rhizobium herbae]|uniref:Transposase n=1 Tax=Rhizobium herbae TaxID=508661 RepID=A0ABS4ERK6_9HYPH|nr:hypothetical protein [Rhizobium herbae]MBP1860572.1 hypothetical protein [Rhizobium herbae]
MKRPETWRHEPAAVIAAQHAPAIVAAAGDHLSYRFFEFFTANIRNPNTRRAYGRWPTLPEACGIIALIESLISSRRLEKRRLCDADGSTPANHP